MSTEVTTLGGGCFWCLEAVYHEVRGVTAVRSGYMGGPGANPTYREVCSGASGHVEVVEVSFDPAVVTYRQVLEIFFTIHDPTTPDRQGNDVGPQYRSVIFWHNDEQKQTAEEVIAEMTKQVVFDDPIVTAMQEATTFWPAEDYHQNYFRDNPNQPYCSFVVSPKVQKFRRKLGHLRQG